MGIYPVVLHRGDGARRSTSSSRSYEAARRPAIEDGTLSRRRRRSTLAAMEPRTYGRRHEPACVGASRDLVLAVAGHRAADARRLPAAATRPSASRLAIGAGAASSPSSLLLCGAVGAAAPTAFRRSLCRRSVRARSRRSLVLLGSALDLDLMSLDYMRAREHGAVRVPDAHAVRHPRHDDDGLGQRPDLALCRPRAAEPARSTSSRPSSAITERSTEAGPQVFRPRRAVLGHAALRRLHDLRLRRHHVASPAWRRR